MSNDPDSFRWQLKRQTNSLHEQLDAAISKHDLATETGVLQFLRIQRDGFAWTLANAQDRTKHTIAEDLFDRLARDLNNAEAPTEADDLAETETIYALHPLAVDYVIAGSRLGSKFLKKRWQSGDAQALGSSYFTAPDHIDYWRRTSQALEEVAIDTSLADEIVSDVNAIFNAFATATVECVERSG